MFETENIAPEIIRNTIVLGIPTALVGSLAFEISFTNWHEFLLKIYAIYLCLYLLIILYSEYLRFPELHNLKSQPVDAFLIIFAFISLREFSNNTSDIQLCLMWLGIFLLCLCCWEIYTIRIGIEVHFKEKWETLRIPVMARLFIATLTYKFDRASISHWDEYRYWLVLDGLLCAVIFSSFANADQLQRLLPVSLMHSVIVIFGLYIGMFNTWRYRIVVANHRARDIS